MRDIRNDLKERLAEIEAERNHLEQMLSKLTETEDNLRIILAVEESRWENKQQQMLDGFDTLIKGDSITTPLSRFLINSLSKGGKDIATLKNELKQTDLIKSKVPGRAIHFALVGMMNAGKVEKENGLWRVKNGKSGEVAE